MIVIDFETRATCDLKACGASVYARHPETSILCLAWQVDSDPVQLWTPKTPPHEDSLGILFDLIKAGYPIEAHNAFFERNIWRWIGVERLGWPDVPFEQWRCSAAACCRLALPRHLAGAGAAVGLKMKKDEAGHRVMMRLCKPKPINQRKGGIWDNDPTKFQILYDYCKQDVRAESELASVVGPLPKREQRIWELDQIINLRGIPVDLKAIDHALAVIEGSKALAEKRLSEITEGAVQTSNQVARLKSWILDQGEDLPDLSKDTVEKTLQKDLPDDVREVLEIRQSLSKSSTGKLQAMKDRADEDGRVRGNLLYHGASTGRWSGAGIQIQNYPRGSLKPEQVELVHRLLPHESPELLDLVVAPPMDCLVSSLRSFIRAEEGKTLFVCDFASIEARALAWVAGETDLLDSFHQGADVYVDMASAIYEVPPEEVTKIQRHVGKTAVLGCGYGMGAKAFQSTCLTMAGVKISRKFAKKVIKAYRTKNAAIAQLWKDLNSAAIDAIQNPGEVQFARTHLALIVQGEWLKVFLPSERELHYREPELVEVQAPWSKGMEGALFADVDLEEELEEMDISLGTPLEGDGFGWFGCSVPDGRVPRLRELGVRMNLKPKEPQYIHQIQFKGVQSPSRKWGLKRTYGGSLTENVVQAIARDLLAEAMLRLDREGFSLIATVHDEVICEEPEGADLARFEYLMTEVPRWAQDCPIAVESYSARRYRK